MIVKAIVKGDELACYEWEAEDELVITHKIAEMAEGCYLYHAINKTKDEQASVLDFQIIFIDDPTELIKSEPVYDDSHKMFFGTPSKYYVG